MRSKIIEQVAASGQKAVNEIEAKQILHEAGINVTRTLLAKTKQEAALVSARMGFPVALKVISPDILHKTDAGGVELDLANERQVELAYERIMQTARARYPLADIVGVSVQKMAAKGVEVIIGMSRDPQFGPMLMFGLGGVFVEVLKDVSFKIIPLTKRDARDMLSEIKGYRMLKGFRGFEPVNEEALIEVLSMMSDLVEANPEIEEIDINPLFAGKDTAVAVDARIILSQRAKGCFPV